MGQEINAYLQTRRITQRGLKGDRYAGRFTAQHAALHAQGIKHAEEVINEKLMGDMRRTVVGSAGTPVVVRNGAPVAAQRLERWIPDLSAADPTSVSDKGFRSRAKGAHQDIGVIEMQEHGLPPMSSARAISTFL